MNHATPNRSFYTAAVVLLIACFLPGGFAAWFGGRLGELTIPLSAPLLKLSMVVRAVPERLDPKDPEFVKLQNAHEEDLARIKNLESQLASLTVALSRLQSLQAIDPSFRFLMASRVAESPGKSGLFKVSEGSLSGVPVGAMALYEHYQLAGRVTALSPRSATITPITATAYGPISALVIPEDGSFDKALSCSLDPVGDGSFIGVLGIESPVKPGLRVVLRDTDWKQLNTGPLIGLIETVKPKDDAPLWNVIIVRPQINLEDVSIVYLKFPRAGASGGGDN